MPKFVKGSEEAKLHMAKLRAMQKKSKTLKGKGGNMSRPNRRVQPENPNAREADELDRLYFENVGQGELLNPPPPRPLTPEATVNNVSRRINMQIQNTPREGVIPLAFQTTPTGLYALPLERVPDVEIALNNAHNRNIRVRRQARQYLGGNPVYHPDGVISFR